MECAAISPAVGSSQQQVMSLTRSILSSRPILFLKQPPRTDWICLSCQRTRSSARFSTSARARQEQQQDRRPFGTRLRTALRNTKVQWKPIPVGLGIAFLGAIQFYRIREREKRRQYLEEDQDAEGNHKAGEENKNRPRKRKRIRPSGPWYARPILLLRSKLTSKLGKYRSCQHFH